MTLGDIKAEALRLMGADVDVDGDTVGDMEYDDNYSLFYNGMVGALNRAFSDLEVRRVLPLCRRELVSPVVKGGRACFMLDGIEDLFAPARLAVEGEDYWDDDHPYRYEAGRLSVEHYDTSATYELLYYPRLARLTHLTSNGVSLPLPDALATALPYYIKADLFRVDEPGEANDARNWYEAAVDRYAAQLECGVQRCVETVFLGG